MYIKANQILLKLLKLLNMKKLFFILLQLSSKARPKASKQLSLEMKYFFVTVEILDCALDAASANREAT